MKRFIALIFCAIFSVTAFAGISTENLSGFNKLTDAQKAEFAKQIAEKAAQNENPAGDATVEKIDKYAELGQKIGSGLVAAAKEMGVAANDFVRTPVGKITAAIIIWHFVGSALVHLIGAFFLVFVCIPLFMYIFRRYFYSSVQVKKLTRTNYKGEESTKEVLVYVLGSDTSTGMYFTIFLCIVGALISLFTM